MPLPALGDRIDALGAARPQRMILEPISTSEAARIAAQVASSAPCTRRQVGAVIRDKDMILASVGVNSIPTAFGSCAIGDCPRGTQTYGAVPMESSYVSTPYPCHAIHAEERAVLDAAGEIAGGDMFITHEPCPNCRRFLYGTGLTMAYWPGGYLDLTQPPA